MRVKTKTRLYCEIQRGLQIGTKTIKTRHLSETPDSYETLRSFEVRKSSKMLFLEEKEC